VADTVLTKNEKKEQRKSWIDKDIMKPINDRQIYKNNKTLRQPEKPNNSGWHSRVVTLPKNLSEKENKIAFISELKRPVIS